MGCAHGCMKMRKTGQFEDDFVLGSELGKGHFATVRNCKDKKTGTQYAVKIINRKRMANPEYLKEEVDILRKVGEHRHCVQLYSVYEDSANFYLVMELCSGGDLFSRIVEYGNYTEKAASRSMRQLASAILHIHSKGVTHRDLKPENILLQTIDPDADIKVADFGLSKALSEENGLMKTICGTWAYCAPEVIEQKSYDKTVDNWTLGVLMYILLSGYHPFDEYGDLSEPELLEKILACDYNFDDPVWEEISEDPKNIIRGLLQTDPKKRMSVQGFLDSLWVAGTTARERSLPSVIQRMQSFNESRRQRGSMLSRTSTYRSVHNPERTQNQRKANAAGIIEEDDSELEEEVRSKTASISIARSPPAALQELPEDSATTITTTPRATQQHQIHALEETANEAGGGDERDTRAVDPV